MRVWDTDLLTKSKIEPVTDGLILWVDGRDAPSSNKIYERVSNSYLVPTQTVGSWAQSSDGKFLEGLVGVSAWGSYNSYHPDAKTLEMCISPETLYSYFFADNNTDLAYVSRNYTDPPYIRGIYRITGSSSGAYFYPPNFPQHYVIRPDSIMYNGQKELVSGTIQTAFNIALRINSWSVHLIKIGALRAYNRVLTDKEIMQNYKYEKSIGRVAL